MLLTAPHPVQLRPGMRISHSVVVRKRVYTLRTKDEIQNPIITISGKNVTVDFNGATLQGTSQDTPPDQRKGLAILVENGKNITIKNAHIHGYKLAVLAKNTTGLHLSHCDWSYNWKQHLKSTLQKENESDWMSFHHNEHDEWIYGAKDEPAYGCGGVYLTDCGGFEVDHCINTGSQCGLMLNRCEHGQIWGNDFSYLSAIGIGLYRSSHNILQQNRIDYCVRGYSHAVYSRGQDSAGILVYEQSSNNTFAYNSATHGGDGFFLWAGQTTMDSGAGGCNENVVYENDFSHSPANGIEATFSWNTFVGNKLVECWHGVWGGYSFDSEFVGNVFKYCGQAISIEHGRLIFITKNEITDCDNGIGLWANPPDPNWEYPKRHETTSRDYNITGDIFSRIGGTAISLGDTQWARIHGCMFDQVVAGLEAKGDCSNLDQDENHLAYMSNHRPITIVAKDLLQHPADALPVQFPKIMRRDGSNILESDPANVPGAFKVAWPPKRDQSWPAAERKLATKYFNIEKKPVPDEFWRADLRGDERGRKYILVKEWGPYDFRSPILWPRGEFKASAAEAGREPEHARSIVQRFEILGPRGHWRVIAKQGVDWLSAEQGAAPGLIDVKTKPGNALNLILEFRGEAITTPFGRRIAANQTYRFSYSQSVPPH